ncbi:MAG: tRNA pseudouridine(38-40) synthase TruA [Lachnospiraceae bacterium]|uniref:tRNA pseudouridine(38-40) synthase TruA n=1 Tax=Parablautia sp. Marseille-Q6255 TaxID=3039593 RepID=UPI0024BBF18E|nr:tRNA pseudouridine(38-40) synthase TruA [Parablautia sp. Marseille-Q6255]
MANFCLVIQYDGTRYNGWQRQGNTSDTIQEKLENILAYLYGEPVELNGSGRTDAGVHALRQIANYRVPRIVSRYSCREILDYFNRYLPQDIRILSVIKAPDRFHARLSATSKTYEYRIDCGPIARVFDRKYLYRIEEPLNLPKMQEAAALMTGPHDFRSFCANRHMKKSTVRTIYDISFAEQDGVLSIRYRGDGFLYNMVRILTGTLIEVGLGDRLPSQVAAALEHQDRSLAGFTAPAQGLFLTEVEYPEELFS